MEDFLNAIGRILEGAATLGISKVVAYLMLIPIALSVTWVIWKAIRWYLVRLRRRAAQRVKELPGAVARRTVNAVADVGNAAGKIAADAGRGAVNLAAQHAVPAGQLIGEKALNGAVAAKDAAVAVAPIAAHAAVNVAVNAAPAAARALGAVAGFVAGHVDQVAGNLKKGYAVGRDAANSTAAAPEKVFEAVAREHAGTSRIDVKN